MQLLEASNQAAVDKAFHILSRKLDFLKNIDPDLLIPRYRETKDKQLVKFLLAEYGRKKFEVGDAFKRHENAGHPSGRTKERQFRNRLKKICDKLAQNTWRLKPEHIK